MTKYSPPFTRVATTIAAALLATGLFLTSADSRNFAVPAKNPVITLNVPDNWKVEEIEFGFSAVSPGKDVFSLSNTPALARSTP